MYIKQQAKNNTLFYRQIFNCAPDDTFEKFSDFKNKKVDAIDLKSNYEKYNEQIKGHIVEFPLNFLSKQKLDRKPLSLEKFADVKIVL